MVKLSILLDSLHILLLVFNKTIICYGTWSFATIKFPVSYTKKVCIAWTGQYNWNETSKISSSSLTGFTVSGNASTSQTGIRNWISVGF